MTIGTVPFVIAATRSCAGWQAGATFYFVASSKAFMLASDTLAVPPKT